MAFAARFTPIGAYIESGFRPMNKAMGLRIRTNVAAMRTQGHLSRKTREVEGSYARLSSGLRITRAGDDAAGLSVSERMRAKTRSLAMAGRNIEDGKSLLNVAEAAVQSIGEQLGRLRELSVQAASGTLNAGDRATIQLEVDERTDEIDRIIGSVRYGDFLVLDGERVEIQIGIDASEFVTFGLPNTDAASLQGVLGIDLSTAAGASAALFDIDRAVRWGGRESGKIGAQLNRLQSASVSVQTARRSLKSSESRIRDADFAQEASQQSRAEIMQQSAAAVLVQANAQPELSLQLMGGLDR